MNFFDTHITPRARGPVNDVLRSGHLSAGTRVQMFEHQLTERLGLVNPVTTNSGTSALHLALEVAGVGRGDEVILPAQTCIATGMAILMAGATPVFADINMLTGNITPRAIAEKATLKTRAIIPVHWGGYPCDLEGINEIAYDLNIPVIEDAAQALGARYRGKPIGSISEFTAFSFQAIKHLTTGDGGALCCLRANDARQARNLSWFGIDRTCPTSALGERVYDVARVGYKYHMNDVAAAIGLGNLQDLSAKLAQRQASAVIYLERLKDVPGLRLLDWRPDRTHAFWIFTILVENREGFIRKLREQDVAASVVHQRIDRYSVFGGPYNLPGQAAFDEKQVSLPLHEGIDSIITREICDVVEAGW